MLPKNVKCYIHRLFPAGLFLKIPNDDTISLEIKNAISHSHESDKSCKLGIYDLKEAFLILLIGHTLAFTAFLIEITPKSFVTQYWYTIFYF